MTLSGVILRPPERSKNLGYAGRFFVAEFTLSAAEGLLRIVHDLSVTTTREMVALTLTLSHWERAISDQ